MTRNILSPTPVTGVRTEGGKPGVRLPVQQFQNEHPLAWNLYIQALARWQASGTESSDRNAKIGTSYFQVTGVHGVPYVPWQDDPTKVEVMDAGYCTHRSVLFVPWHRPYLLLYEQILFEYAREIAGEFSGQAKQDYLNALDDVRLPFWDWSRDSQLPPITMKQKISVDLPGETEGSKRTELIDNPLYSYKFTSEYAKEQIKDVQSWNQQYLESKRCPDKDGESQMDIANNQMRTYTKSFKSSTHKLITSVKNFDEFSTNAWKSGLKVQNYGSVEAMHNDVHNHTGTQDIQNVPTGNMTALFGSTFDPIFWLHHVHIDRLAAIWQAINPEYTIEPLPSDRPRFTAKAGTLEGVTSHLEPFHKTGAHSMEDYHTTEDTKEVINTFEYGYQYPETPLEYIKDPVAMRNHALTAVNKLYGPPLSFVGGPVDSISPNLTEKNWQVFIRVKNFALSGAWGIHIFLGPPPSTSDNWFMAENRVGTISILSNENIDHCPNCQQQSASRILVTGAVDLNSSLRKNSQDTSNVDDVVKFLHDNLTWRVAKDSTNVPITDDMDLVVGVSATDVTYPASMNDAPTWGNAEIFPEVTVGKIGGLQQGLQL